MNQKFSIGFKLGEDGDQIINFSPLMPKWARISSVARAECEGALSWIKTKSRNSERGYGWANDWVYFWDERRQRLRHQK